MVDPETTEQTDAAANATKMQAKLARMQQSVRMGGKGTMRRKKKAVHRAAPTDDKRLQATIKRMGLSQISSIEEVNLFRDNGQVTNFVNPKVQALIAANTYVISGTSQTKPLEEMLPSLINQLGPDNIKNIRNLMESLAANEGGEGAAGENGDDDVPDLMESETFEEAEGAAAAEEKPAEEAPAEEKAAEEAPPAESKGEGEA